MQWNITQSLKKECNLTICDMDGLRGYCDKWKIKINIDEFTCEWNLKIKTNEETAKQKQSYKYRDEFVSSGEGGGQREELGKKIVNE